MTESVNVHYQKYEETYRRALEANQSGRQKEAKRLFLEASNCLLLAARDTEGPSKTVWIERAKRLSLLSDSIVIPAARIEIKMDPQNTISASGSKNASDASKPSAARDAGQIRNQNEKSNGDEESFFIPSEKPNVHFDDIAGLDYVKETINRRIILPRKHPDVYRAFGRSLNSGILLYGPPGTGKTMIAKAIATEIDAVFYSIRCSDIVGKYFGEAEKNVKALFETARSQETAILFFDEFEALATKRGGHSTVMNRLVPELLSQMDGFAGETEKTLILLAATNRPWDLDSAFLRPPRLTEKIYVGLPDEKAREYLIRRKFMNLPLEGDFTIEEIVNATEGFNAADVNEFCESMKDGAIQRTLEINEGKFYSPINADDFRIALQTIHSSVQKSDITALQKWEATQNIG